MADYSITAVDRRVVYSGSAGTGPYAFTFPVLATSDIAVYKDSTKLVEGSGSAQYTVSLSASTGTGSVTLGAAATGSNTITITGARAIQRTTDFVTAGDLLASSLNTELDSQTIFVQQVSEDAGRAIKAPVTDPTSIDMTLPLKADRLGKIMSFNSSTGNPEVGLTTVEVTGAAASAAAAALSETAAENSKNAAATSAASSAASATAANTDGAAQVTLATAQVGLATTQANLATSNGAAQVALATTQAGNAATSATAASNNGAAQVALAAAQVALATTQAGLATTNGAAQVALATTQAGNSAASAVTAASETTDAETAKTASEAAQVAAAASAASATSSANAAEAAAAAIFYKYKTSTLTTNPPAGGVRFNNASMPSVTTITFSATSASTGNPDVSDYIVRWDDSTSPVKGHIIIRESGAPGSSIVFAISGSITDNGTHLNVPVSHITSAGVSLSADDDLYFSFTRTGDAGDLSDPMTTRGDIIIRNSSNALARLGTGAANRVLISDGTDPAYGQVPLATAVSGILPLANGGTNASTAAAARTQLGLGTAAVAASTSFEAADSDILRADTIDELAVGYSGATTDGGVQTGGTFSPSPDTSGGGMLHYVNGGAHTLGVPSKNCSLVILMKNNVSAGAVTTSGFTKVDGDPLTTTNSHEFFLYLTRYSDGSTTFSSLTVKALQ